MAQEPSGEERTEDATPQRRSQARLDGQVPKSQELSAAVLLLLGTAMLASIGGEAAGNHLVSLLRQASSWLARPPFTVLGATGMIRVIGWSSLSAMLPAALGLLALVLLVNLVQSRGVLSLKPLVPDLARISPLTGFGRLFSLDSVFGLIRSLLKMIVLGLVTYAVLRRMWPGILHLPDTSAANVAATVKALTVKLAFTTGFAFLTIAVADYGYQVWQFEKRLKMSRQEVTREHKEQEGDPFIKSRIRQIARQRARRRMLAQVAKADVVVTNPTHIAVALKYDISLAGAPVVLAMGERKLAERIKAIAKASGVPVIENKPLAQALLATATIGRAIPPALYVAVAEILAFVYRQRAKTRRPSVLRLPERSS